FSFVILTLIIQLLYVIPRRIIVAVLIMFRTIFCAVPAFIRVDPVMISAPTAKCTVVSAIFDIGEFSEQTIATVFAPLLLANSSAARVYGVAPAAAMAMTRSFSVSFFDFRSIAAFSRSSSAPSMALANDFVPPAITAWTHSAGALNVGGISAASVIAMRPLVPAPT